MSTSPSPRHHITTPRPATPLYIQILVAPWTQAADRLTHPASRWARFFVRQRSFVPLRPSGSSRMVEVSQLETAVAARRSILAPAGPPWRKGLKKQSRVPLLRSERVRIYRPCSIIRGLIPTYYCYMATRTRPLPIIRTRPLPIIHCCCGLLKWCR